MKDLINILLGCITILLLGNILIGLIPKGIRRGLVATISLLTTIIIFVYKVVETVTTLVIKQVSSYLGIDTKTRKTSPKKPSNVIDFKEKAK